MNQNQCHDKKRWVLLEHLPAFFSMRLFFLLFLYSLSFTLLLVGLKLFHLEHKANNTPNDTVSAMAAPSQSPDEEKPLYQQISSQELQQTIADSIIRLHVIANSDSENDQALKLKVRDEILQQMQSTLSQAVTVSQARELLVSEKEMIREIAGTVITAQGYDYPVSVSLEQRYFPAKNYGDLTFPPGYYNALCVEIGKADGRNWWCVLFPSLCFVDETQAVVPDESKKRLEEELPEDAYNSLSSPSPSPEPEVHSAIYDWLFSRN